MEEDAQRQRVEGGAQSAVFTIDYLGKHAGPEFVIMANDILRMLCIQIAIQIMIVMSGSGQSIFSTQFLLLLLYVAIGVMLYWVAVRRIVVFV